MREWKISQARSDTLGDKLAELELQGWEPHTILPNGVGGILVAAARPIRVAEALDDGMRLLEEADRALEMAKAGQEDLRRALEPKAPPAPIDVDWEALKQATADPEPAPSPAQPAAPARPKRSRK